MEIKDSRQYLRTNIQNQGKDASFPEKLPIFPENFTNFVFMSLTCANDILGVSFYGIFSEKFRRLSGISLVSSVFDKKQK